MQQLMSIIRAILAAFGLASKAQQALSSSESAGPPSGIGSLDPEDPSVLGDITFELAQAEGLGTTDEVAKKYGFKNKAQAEDAIMRIRTYHARDAGFGAAIDARVGERSRQLLAESMADPAAMARRYQS